jgi:hypothetical protein
MRNTVFYAIATKEGGLDTGSEYNRSRLKNFLIKNAGVRLIIEAMTPESIKQRGFFEGAMIPMITFYQDFLDHRNRDDNRKVREWVKIEFNGEFVVIGGISAKVAKSSKGELNRGFLERVRDWMDDQGYKTELLNPKDYFYWRDKVFPNGGPDNYIDYLVLLNKMP